MHRSFKFHAQQSHVGRQKVRARRSKVPRNNRVRRIFFFRLLSRDILRRAHGKRHLEMFFHIRPHAALVLTHLSISWLLSLSPALPPALKYSYGCPAVYPSQLAEVVAPFHFIAKVVVRFMQKQKTLRWTWTIMHCLFQNYVRSNAHSHLRV